MPTWSTGIPLKGADGLSVLSGSGAPAAALGVAGQIYVDVTNAVLYQKSASGWPASGKSLIGPASTTPGPQGLSVQSGSGAPAASLGNVGDIYVDTAAGVLYAAKTSSGYPTPGKSLVGAASTVPGPQGVSLQNGSGAPASSLGNVGDAYLDTTNALLYAAKTSSGYPTPGKSLIGPASTVPGPQGLSVQSGSGAPANSLGNVGDIYVDTANGLLYAAKTSSGYPTPAKSLVGPTGTGAQGAAGSQIYSGTGTPPAGTGTTSDYFFATDTYTLTGPKQSATSWSGATSTVLRGATGNVGAAGSQIISGTGTPPSGTGAINDYFFATDTTTLTGPKPSATSWSGATSTVLRGATGAAGNTIRNGTSAPSASTPSQAGDFYLQTGSSPVLYGPSTGGAGTYPSTGVSLVGPQGASGSGSASTVGSSGLTFADNTVQTTAFPGAIALGTTAASTGPAVWYNGGSLTSTAVNMQAVGTTVQQNFQPAFATGFYGAVYTVYSNTANPVYIQLYNATDSVAIWTSPSSIAAGTVASVGPFAIATYPMAANKNYVWRISGNGASYANIIPQYFTPSSVPYSTQYPTPSYLTQTTAVTSTATACKIAGTTNLTQYYRFPTGVFFNYALLTNFAASTTSVVFQLAGSSVLYSSASVAAGNSLAVGPFGPGQYYMTANTNYVWQVTGSGNAQVSVNWSVVG